MTMLLLLLSMFIPNSYDDAKYSFSRQKYAETIQYAQQAIDESLGKEAASHYYIGHSLIALSQPTEAIPHLQTSLAMYTAKKSLKGEYLAALGMARCLIELERYDEAHVYLKRAVRAYQQVEEKARFCFAYYYTMLSKINLANHEYKQAFINQENAYIWYKKFDIRKGMCDTLTDMGFISMILGDYTRGVQYTLQSEKYAIELQLSRQYYFNLLNWTIYLKCHSEEYDHLLVEIREYIVVNHDTMLENNLNDAIQSRCL